jgi:hypothetical protein
VRHSGSTGGRGPSSVVGTYLPTSLEPFPKPIDWEVPEDVVDLGIVFPGENVDVAVLAKDELHQEVMRAQVHWEPDEGSVLVSSDGETFGVPNETGDDPVHHDDNGLATATVQFDTKGLHVFTASGVGYATPVQTGANGLDGLEDVSPTPFTITFQAVVDNTLIGTFTETPQGRRNQNVPPVRALVTVGDGVTPVAGVTVTITGVYTNNGQPTELLCASEFPEPHDPAAIGCIWTVTDENGIATFDDLLVTKTGVLHYSATAAKEGFDTDHFDSKKFHIKP